MIIGGIAALLAVRELPPDASLAEVRKAGALMVCAPPALPGLLEPQPGDDGYAGIEAGLVRSVAEEIGVPVQWNPQPGWGNAIDPSDWGMRPSACNLVVGGIVASAQTRALLDLVPYAREPWAFAGNPEADTAGLLLPFWGIDRGRAARWLRDQGYQTRLFFDAERAREALRAGDVGAVLSLRPVAHWLAGDRLPVTPTEALPARTLAVATWKGRTTLNRALRRALPPPQ